MHYAAVRRDIPGLGLSGWVEVFAYCDDWLVIAQYENECSRVWGFLLDLLETLGFAINRLPHKCVAPCTSLVWLALQLDSRNMTIALPSEKVSKAIGLVRTVQSTKSVTRHQLDSLFGYLLYLLHCCVRGAGVPTRPPPAPFSRRWGVACPTSPGPRVDPR